MEMANLEFTVYARVYSVWVREDGKKETGQKPKPGERPSNAANHREQSKLKFYWENGVQMRKWVNYEFGEFDDV